jgi:hypothetical protein
MVTLAAAAAALVGCGGEPGELLVLTTSGGGEATQRLVVEGDSRGSCDNGPEQTLPSEVILDAREVERELSDAARDRRSYTTGAPADARRYTLSTKDGIVHWTEGARPVPAAVGKAIALRQNLKRALCGG